MLKLIQSGLFGDRLIPVDSKSLTDRYNACLTELGLPQTKLKKFHIDGWGWSPEIAEETKDRYYLSHGTANPYGIILTPDQQHASLYFPYHSFDWDIHQRIYEAFKVQIDDITTQSPLWFELDQDISAYRQPQDLLNIQSFNIRFHSTNNLATAAREQKELIRQFMDTEMGWSDQELRKKIVTSSAQYGDLRYRNLDIRVLPFAEISSFYTSVFDGLYILRHNGNKDIMIFEANASEVSGKSKGAHIEYNLNDPNLPGFLFSQELVSDAPEFHMKNIDLLEHQLDLVLFKAAYSAPESVIEPAQLKGELTDARKKGLIHSLLQNDLLGDEYFELEKLIGLFKKGVSVNSSDVGASLKDHLIHPHPSLNVSARTIVWQLISVLFRNNEILHYTFNKPSFYTHYPNWNPHFQDWVIGEITRNRGIFKRLIRH